VLPRKVSRATLVSAGRAIASSADAIKVFRELWKKALRARFEARDAAAAKAWDLALSQRALVSAGRGPCKGYIDRMYDTLGPGESAAAIIERELDGATDCWLVSAAEGFDTLIVVLVAPSGDVVLVWAPPEG